MHLLLFFYLKWSPIVRAGLVFFAAHVDHSPWARICFAHLLFICCEPSPPFLADLQSIFHLLRSISMLKPGWLLKYCLETGLQKNRPLGHMWASQPNDLIQPYQLSDINGNWKSYNYCSIVSNAPFIGANFECSWLKIKGILTVWNKKQYRQRECTSCSLWEKKLIFVCHCQLILTLKKFLEGADAGSLSVTMYNVHTCGAF